MINTEDLKTAIVEDISEALKGALPLIRDHEEHELKDVLDSYFLEYARNSGIRKNNRAEVLLFHPGKTDDMTDDMKAVQGIHVAASRLIETIEAVGKEEMGVSDGSIEKLENISVTAYAYVIKKSMEKVISEHSKRTSH